VIKINNYTFIENSANKESVENLKFRLSPFLSETISGELLDEVMTGSLTKLYLEGLPFTDKDLIILMSYCPNLECNKLDASVRGRRKKSS